MGVEQELSCHLENQDGAVGGLHRVAVVITTDAMIDGAGGQGINFMFMSGGQDLYLKIKKVFFLPQSILGFAF